MKTDLKLITSGIARLKKRQRIWKRVLVVLASIVVFVTTYALILPAITKENVTFCGHEEHQHTDGCYQAVLICGLKEEKGREAYTPEPVVVTETVTEIVTEQVLVSEGHAHSEDCQDEEGNLICGQEEKEAVYEEQQKEVTREVTKEIPQDPVPAVAGHTHTDACYQKNMVCGKEEHSHALQCFSNPNADLENAEMWEQTLPKKEEYTEDWREDLLLVAKSQLGYRESSRNYQVLGDKVKGYSRYGAYHHDAYGDWCAMFIRFCMDYAGIDQELMPSSVNVHEWMSLADRIGTYQKAADLSAESFDVKPGDLVFFDWEQDGRLDHIAIVNELKQEEYTVTETAEDGSTTEKKLTRIGSIVTIEGNSLQDNVASLSYGIHDERIAGYAALPEKPEDDYALAEAKARVNSALTGRPFEEAYADYLSRAELPPKKNTETGNGQEEIAEEPQSNQPAEETQTLELATRTSSGVIVRFSAPVSAIPEDASIYELQLFAEEITQGGTEYDEYEAAVKSEYDEAEVRVTNARFFDIKLLDARGEEVKLVNESLATVGLVFPEEENLSQENALDVMHFAEDGIEVLTANTEEEDTSVSFTTPGFSVFGVVETVVIETRYISAEGNVFRVKVAFEKDAGIPEDAVLSLKEYDPEAPEVEEIRKLHQPLSVFLYDTEDVESLIEKEVQWIMAAQNATMERLMSNGDFDEAEFEKRSEDEIRAELQERFSGLTTYRPGKTEDSLALLDISILDADGNEVEPQAPVQVEIVMESIPDDASGLDLKNTLQVEHYVEGENGLESEIVVSPDAAAGEIWVTEEDVVTATFTTDSFSFYTLAWNEHDDQLELDVMRFIVYYGFMIEGKFREFGNNIKSGGWNWMKPGNAEEDTTGGDHGLLNGKDHVYELYKKRWVEGVDGYGEYKYSRAVLARDGYNGGGEYEIAETRKVTITATGKEIEYKVPVVIGNETDGYTVLLKNGTTQRLGNADKILVLYDSPYKEGMDYNTAKTSSTEPGKRVYGGDQYGLKTDGSSMDPLGVPEHTKTLSENQSSGRNDNTYRLSLTATGKVAQTKENTKVDIILVTDLSGSMSNNNNAGVKKLTNAVNQGLLPQLKALDREYGTDEDPAIMMNWISFSTDSWFTKKDTRAANFNFTGLYGSGATNYEHALQRIAQVKTRADAKPYVIFITDGNPTVRNSVGEIASWQGQSPNYGGAYQHTEYFWTFKDGKWKWITGAQANYGYGNDWVYGGGTENWAEMRDCYNVTIPYVQRLVKNKLSFNVIATLPGVSYAAQMVNVGNETVPGSSSFYDAHDVASIKAAFSDILDTIKKDLSYKFVTIDDEMSAVAETTLVETPEDFEYFKYPSHIRFVNNMTDMEPDTHTNAKAVDENGDALDANGDLCSDSGLPQATRADFVWTNAPAAIYVPSTDTQKGSVSWPLNTVEVKNETYEVTFTVYPNREGWDLITALSNHWNDPNYNWERHSVRKAINQDGSVDLLEIKWDEELEDYVPTGKKLLSVDASGIVRTASNDRARLTYIEVDRFEENGVERVKENGPYTTEYPTPYMEVSPSEFKIRKIWKDTLVPRWPMDQVTLEVWRVSRGDVDEGDGFYSDSETGDFTDKSEVAYVHNGETFYWSAEQETITIDRENNLAGYINIHEPDEALLQGDSATSGKTILSKTEFNSISASLDDQNYLVDGSGNRRTNANGHLIQYFPFWEAGVNIAPGLIATSLTNGLEIPLPGAKGHFFALREADTGQAGGDFKQHFELSSSIVHPMKRDGIMDRNASRLDGTNARKGELAITKMVLTEDRHEIHPDVPFQVTVSLTDRDGGTLTMDVPAGVDDDGQTIYNTLPRDDIEYVVYDGDGNVVNIDTIGGSSSGAYEVGITDQQIDQGAATSAYHKTVPYNTATGKHELVFSKLYADWTIVFVNIPTGAKWTVQETYNNGITGAEWMDGISNGYVFEGYTLPDVQRGHETLHPQPHFLQDRTHYSGGTVNYNPNGSINESALIKVTDYDHDSALNVTDEAGDLVAAANGAAAKAISGYIDADAEELVDIHNVRIADDLEIRKVDQVDETTSIPLAGARFVIESRRPQTEWILHTEYDDEGLPVDTYWAERYVFGSNTDHPDSPNMTEVIGPAHYPATIHIHGTERYVVRGDVIGTLYAAPVSEWTEISTNVYQPVPLDLDGNRMENVRWVEVPSGAQKGTAGVNYVSLNGKDYILRRSTRIAGAYEMIPDTMDANSHVYYYVESTAGGVLRDPDPNHVEKAKLSLLPIIEGASTTYDMHEIVAPGGYMTAYEEIREKNANATWNDAKFTITVNSERTWDSEQGRSVPYIDWTDPRTGDSHRVLGRWDDTKKHWAFRFSIVDKRDYSELKLKKHASHVPLVRTSYQNLKLKDTSVNPQVNYYNVLATSEVTSGNWNSGKTVIWYTGYQNLVNAGRIDEQGYALTHDQSARMKDANGCEVLYLPLECGHSVSGDHTAACYTTGSGDARINDALTPGMAGVEFSLYQEFDHETPSGIGSNTPGDNYLAELSPNGYYNILGIDNPVEGAAAGQQNTAEYGRTWIENGGYNRVNNAGRIDSEGYLLTEDKSARFVDRNGNLVRYVPRYKSNNVELALAVNKAGQLLQNLTTDGDGNIEFGALKPGVYWLFEKQPSGYNAPKPTRIEVTRDGVVYRNAAQNSNQPVSAEHYTDVTDGKPVTTYEIDVVNTPEDLALPNTGGIGTYAFTGAGILLILFAAAIFFLKFRKNHSFG